MKIVDKLIAGGITGIGIALLIKLIPDLIGELLIDIGRLDLQSNSQAGIKSETHTKEACFEQFDAVRFLPEEVSGPWWQN
jgi:hypothetical protein